MWYGVKGENKETELSCRKKTEQVKKTLASSDSKQFVRKRLCQGTNLKIVTELLAAVINADLKEKLYLHEYKLYKTRFCERNWRRASLKILRRRKLSEI